MHFFKSGQLMLCTPPRMSERTDVIRNRTLAQYALADVITLPALLLVHC